MITILHGDNLVSSRNRLVELIDQAKNQKKEIVELNGDKITETDLRQALESPSLFGGDRLVLIERLFVRVKSKAKDQLVRILGEITRPVLVIVWEPKEVAKTYLNKLKDSKTELFKTPRVIFQFLDSFSLKLFHQCLKIEAPELIFHLLDRSVSDIIIALDKHALLKQAQWQKDRLVAQARAFSLDQLLALHQQLIDIDTAQKTGTYLTDLSTDLDLLLAKL